MSAAAGSSTVLVSDLIARARALAPLLEAEAPASEAAGQLTERVIEALRADGFLDLLGAAEFGGLDLGPFDSLRVVEELFAIDASVGWIVMVQNTQLKGLNLLPYDTVKAMYANGTPGLAGQGAPGGRAERVEGGYRVSGHWSYASNILHADFVSGTAMVTQNGQPVLGETGTPRMVRLTVERDKVELKGNWDVLGLKASGSLDFEVHDLFVPDEFVTTSAEAATAAKWSAKPQLISIVGWLPWSHTSPELGLGRRILDEIAAFARKPSSRGGRLADDEVFRANYAKAEAAFRSAHAWIYQIWAGIQETVDRGETPTRWQYTQARTALLHAHEVNADNAAFAFREGGGTALRSGVLQRVVRDEMAAGQHLMLSRKWWGEVARDLLGEAEGMEWSALQLVPAR
jgi:alkylation response protein AidB-like acyl-CoA dehydrogenase